MLRVRVIGFGNPAAGDDALGLIAAQSLREELGDTPGVEVVMAGAGIRALDLFQDTPAVIAIDAIRPRGGGVQPGRIVRAEATSEGFAAQIGSALSSHGFGLVETLGLAAALGSVSQVVFFGVEVADVTMGHGLSQPVAGAVPSLVGMILMEIGELLETPEREP